MILVTGATGHLGKATILSLIQKGVSPASIAALVRDESKAIELKEAGVQIRNGDYDDAASLSAAFKGVDKIMFISGNDVVNRLKQHERVLAAAKGAGVKHVVYTSFMRRNESDSSPIALVAKSHIQTEELIRQSGIDYTIMKNGIYADMLPVFMGEAVLSQGIFFPAGSGEAAWSVRADMAEAAAVILTTEGHENKEYDIAGSSSHTLHDVAGILSEITGKEIGYANPTAAEYISTVTKAGMPTAYADIFAGFGEAISQGEFGTHGNELEAIIGRKPTSLKTYLKEVYTNVN